MEVKVKEYSGNGDDAEPFKYDVKLKKFEKNVNPGSALNVAEESIILVSG